MSSQTVLVSRGLEKGLGFQLSEFVGGGSGRFRPVPVGVFRA
ncbi:MAG: hypothetical protein QF752_00425 [Planctomycetota bacterium]|nr:hypothetical protein [Planctomycetota bacterium]